MGKEKIIKILLLFVIVIIISPIIVSADNDDDREWKTVFTWSGTFYALGPSSYPTDIEIKTWKEINETSEDSILFNLTFIPKYPIQGQDFDTGIYFVEDQEIIAIKCYIDKINRASIISNVTLSIITPDGSIYRNISFLDENHTGTNTMKVKILNDEPLIFHSTGIWKLILKFESTTNNLVWKYVSGKGFNELYQTFKLTGSNNPKLKEITFYNEYREAVPVITLSQALEVTKSAFMSKQTDYLNSVANYLNDTATTMKESSEQNTIYQKEIIENNELYIHIFIITAIVAAVSAAISLWNTFNTKKQVKISKKHLEAYTKEEKESRRALFKPKISAKINFFGPASANIRIANIGSGSAQKVKIFGKTHPTEEIFSWTTSFMDPGEYQDILLKKVTWEDFSKNYEKIGIKFMYYDIYDKKIEDKIIINVKEVKKRAMNTTIIWKEEILNKIYKKLEGIESQLKKKNRKN